ncbi:TIGR01666 family membrane protein, partial [Yersinia pestis]
TMFGLGEYQHWYEQPLYFVIGALWYGLTSILFFLLRPTLQVQENLAQSLQHMSDLLLSKAKLFDPDQHPNVENLLYELSLKNTLVIQ